jgi:hypothetical protein
MAALTTGAVDRAVEHLSQAVCRNFALGHWPAVNASRLRYAQALERRGDPGDIATAAEVRSRAADLAGTLAGRLGPPGRTDVASCARHGTKWRVKLGTRSTLVRHSVGMLHLAVLIANPGTEIAAIDLVAGVDAMTGAARLASARSGQHVLDRVAVSQYRGRLSQLGQQAEALESNGDIEGAIRARAERGWLLRELAGGTGPGGRLRRSPTTASARESRSAGRSAALSPRPSTPTPRSARTCGQPCTPERGAGTGHYENAQPSPVKDVNPPPIAKPGDLTMGHRVHRGGQGRASGNAYGQPARLQGCRKQP